MHSVSRLVIAMFSLALVCAVGPFVLEWFGFTFQSMALGGVGDHIAGYQLQGAVLRLDLFLVLSGTLGLIMVLILRCQRRCDCLTGLVALTLATSALVAAVQLIDLPAAGMSEDLFRLRVRLASQMSQTLAGIVLLTGCVAIHLRHRLPRPVAPVAIITIGAGALAVALLVLRHHEPGETVTAATRLFLLGAFSGCAFLLSPELRRRPAPAYVAAVLAGLLPLVSNQMAYLLPGDIASEVTAGNRSILLIWCAYLIPVIGLCVDLARSAALDAQAQEKEYLRRIIDALPDMVYARDGEGRYRLLNRAAADFLGGVHTDLEGSSLHDSHFPAADIARYLAADRHILATGRCLEHPGTWMRDASGRSRFLRLFTQSLPAGAGQPLQVLGVVTDVTRLKEAEQQIEQRLRSERTLRRCLARLVRTPASGFFATMQDVLEEVGRHCQADAAFVYEQDVQAGLARRICGWLDGRSPAQPLHDLSEVTWCLPILAAGEIAVYSDPEQLPADAQSVALGRRLGVRYLMLAPILGDAGQLWGAIGVHCPEPPPDGGDGCRRILGNLADLFAVVRNRILAESALQQAKEAAEASNRAKSEFLANMSHEIRTPLNAVIGIADILRDLEPTLEQARYLTMIDQAGQALLSLIDDILDLSRIEAGKLQLALEPVDLPTFFDETVSMLSSHAQQQGLELRCRLEPAARLRALIDPLRLRQVLLNLLGNAIKFTETGHVALSVDHRDGNCEISVADTGIGIAADKLSQLFEKFTQADSSHTRRYGGSGLGLAISRNLVQMMGGELSIASELGRGTTVTARLPLSGELLPDAPAAMTADATRQSASAHQTDAALGARVLLVEDNIINQKVASRLLESMGCLVSLAENGQVAIEAVQKRSFDLILMDCQMPVLDGLEATRRIRRLPANGGGVPIVAMTANVMQEHRTECLDAGMNDFVSKPVTKQILRTIIERWVGQVEPVGTG